MTQPTPNTPQAPQPGQPGVVWPVMSVGQTLCPKCHNVMAYTGKAWSCYKCETEAAL